MANKEEDNLYNQESDILLEALSSINQTLREREDSYQVTAKELKEIFRDLRALIKQTAGQKGYEQIRGSIAEAQQKSSAGYRMDTIRAELKEFFTKGFKSGVLDVLTKGTNELGQNLKKVSDQIKELADTVKKATDALDILQKRMDELSRGDISNLSGVVPYHKLGPAPKRNGHRYRLLSTPGAPGSSNFSQALSQGPTGVPGGVGGPTGPYQPHTLPVAARSSRGGLGKTLSQAMMQSGKNIISGIGAAFTGLIAFLSGRRWMSALAGFIGDAMKAPVKAGIADLLKLGLYMGLAKLRKMFGDTKGTLLGLGGLGLTGLLAYANRGKIANFAVKTATKMFPKLGKFFKASGGTKPSGLSGKNFKKGFKGGGSGKYKMGQKATSGGQKSWFNWFSNQNKPVGLNNIKNGPHPTTPNKPVGLNWLKNGGAQGAKNTSKTASKKASQKAAQKAAQKTAAKNTAKKGVGKMLAKKIPFLGLGAGLIFAGQRAQAGDWTGAGMETLSGAASIVPGWGTAASLAIDAGIMGRDIEKATTGEDHIGDVINAGMKGAASAATGPLGLVPGVGIPMGFAAGVTGELTKQNTGSGQAQVASGSIQNAIFDIENASLDVKDKKQGKAESAEKQREIAKNVKDIKESIEDIKKTIKNSTPGGQSFMERIKSMASGVFGGNSDGEGDGKITASGIIGGVVSKIHGVARGQASKDVGTSTLTGRKGKVFDGHRITSYFGPRNTKDLPAGASANHGGVDLDYKEGEAIPAKLSGKIIEIAYDQWNGNHIRLSHLNGKYVSTYVHLKSIPKDLKVGDHINAGRIIGYAGHTGLKGIATHLHYAVKNKQGKEIEPMSATESIRKQQAAISNNSIPTRNKVASAGVPTGGAAPTIMSKPVGSEIQAQPMQIASAGGNAGNAMFEGSLMDPSGKLKGKMAQLQLV